MQSAPKPHWLRVKLPSGERYEKIVALARRLELHTVCEEALCPNMGECWGGGTATFMILGDTCTRGCRFCNVKSGNPRGWLDPLEPSNVARAAKELGLSYVVLTSVDRDDLADGGASHFAQTIRAVKGVSESILVEALTPDFGADGDAIMRTVVEAAPDVLGHNVETVRRLTPMVRDHRATYDRSLHVLLIMKELDPRLYTKSSIMVGLGETEEEVIETMRDLRRVGVDILTIGQYLRPSRWNLPVQEYVHPEVFESYRRGGEEMGFLFVASGPLVRSSYRAGELFMESMLGRGKIVDRPFERVASLPVTNGTRESNE